MAKAALTIDLSTLSSRRLAAEEVLTYAYSGSDKGRWPLPSEEETLKWLNTWIALREHDRKKLKLAASWTDPRREYRIDPLAERISDAWASYIAGQESTIKSDKGRDADLYAEMLAGNNPGLGDGGSTDFAAELERAAGIRSSEGEVWPRIYVDEAVAEFPVVDWLSRTAILPYWHGPRLGGAAAWAELGRKKRDPKGMVWRHFEVHVPGFVLNALFAGKERELGQRRELADHPTTADLDEEWETGIDGLLIGRIPNRLRGSRYLGVSDYKGSFDYLLDLNEICATGSHNADLAARKRVVITQAAARTGAGEELADSDLSNGPRDAPRRARFDSREEVFVEDPLDGELGSEQRDPFRIIEYSFDAGAIIEWKRELVESAVTRSGLALQYVGANTGNADGYAISGTALRMRLIPTDAGGRARGRYWDRAIPSLASTLAQVDAIGAGRGRGWTAPAEAPAFERRPGIPIDEVEETQTHAAAVGGGILSLETSLRERFPGKEDSWYIDEIDRIREDQKARGAGAVVPFA